MSSCENYRPIALLNTIRKWFFKVIFYANINFWNVLLETQAGFRRNRSTIDHLFVLHQVIQKRLTKKIATFCAFVDFNKAYDSIIQNQMWKTLSERNFDKNWLEILKSCYSKGSALVLVNGKLSPTFMVKRGLAQGCTLSPSLFNLILDDALRKFNEN